MLSTCGRRRRGPSTATATTNPSAQGVFARLDGPSRLNYSGAARWRHRQRPGRMMQRSSRGHKRATMLLRVQRRRHVSVRGFPGGASPDGVVSGEPRDRYDVGPATASSTSWRSSATVDTSKPSRQQLGTPACGRVWSSRRANRCEARFTSGRRRRSATSTGDGKPETVVPTYDDGELYGLTYGRQLWPDFRPRTDDDVHRVVAHHRRHRR